MWRGIAKRTKTTEDDRRVRDECDLLLARHGQTVSHAENRYAGVSDVALTDEGRTLAEFAAEHP